jgi:hypothetical protein
MVVGVTGELVTSPVVLEREQDFATILPLQTVDYHALGRVKVYVTNKTVQLTVHGPHGNPVQLLAVMEHVSDIVVIQFQLLVVLDVANSISEHVASESVQSTDIGPLGPHAPHIAKVGRSNELVQILPLRTMGKSALALQL